MVGIATNHLYRNLVKLNRAIRKKSVQDNSLGSVHGRFKKTEAVDETVHFRESEDNRWRCGRG